MGLRIRKRREFLGLTREKFAEQVGLSFGFVSGIERGEDTMSIETMMKISSAIKLSPDEILLGNVSDGDIESIDEIVRILKNCTPNRQQSAIELLKLFMVSCEWI